MTTPSTPGALDVLGSAAAPVLTIRANQKATTEQIIAAYRETGSVWKAAKELGMAGQTVHERLRAVGYPMLSRNWTEEETEELANLIRAQVTLSQIAHRLGRPYSGVACKASELGIRSNRRRQKNIPRGAGWDKASTLRHMKALQQYAGKITQYARANGLSIDLFVHALQQHCPDLWAAYLQAHSDLPSKKCPYCGDVFIPTSGKQTYCTRKCANHARADRDYFGGKRRSTVGLAEGTCQLCERNGVKGLSSHHVFGKENDPENDVLLALCPGCHKCVTLLATRNFVDNETAWEALISLVWMRKNGPRFAAGDFTDDHVLHITVDIDEYEEEQ